MSMHRPPRRQRGITLIEALVALAVMAIGMLGLVGVQSTLRGNSDIAKQRAEAVRIAQEEIERLRAYVTLAATAGQVSYTTDLAAGTRTATVPISASLTNATFTRTVLVQDMPKGKQVTVTVDWNDRKGNLQNIRLDTMITEVAPVLTGTVHIPPGTSNYQMPQGRNRAIPQAALPFPDGRTSGFIPPGATGVAWSFDNYTGIVTLCTTTATTTSALTLNNIICNNTAKAILIAGFVRFTGPTAIQPAANAARQANGLVEPGYTVMLNQTDPSAFVDPARPCYMNTVSGPDNYIEYYCLALTSQAPNTPATPISGNVWLSASTVITATTDPSASMRRVCRFFDPRSYTVTTAPWVNQNLLVMPAGDGTLPFHCVIPPTPTPATQLSWPHQPVADPP